MNIKLDNMVDLRAYCVEQAVKYCTATITSADVIDTARTFEEYILSNQELSAIPYNSDKLLYECVEKLTQANNNTINISVDDMMNKFIKQEGDESAVVTFD